MKKLLLITILIASSAFATPDHKPTKKEIHKKLCNATAEEYGYGPSFAKLCLDISELEYNDTTGSAELNTLLCLAGVMVTAEYNYKTKKISIGDSGIESDMCDDSNICLEASAQAEFICKKEDGDSDCLEERTLLLLEDYNKYNDTELVCEDR